MRGGDDVGDGAAIFVILYRIIYSTAHVAQPSSHVTTPHSLRHQHPIHFLSTSFENTEGWALTYTGSGPELVHFGPLGRF
jgi:hypothetical protein